MNYREYTNQIKKNLLMIIFTISKIEIDSTKFILYLKKDKACIIAYQLSF